MRTECSTWNITPEVPPPRPHWVVFVDFCSFSCKKTQIGRSSRAGALPPRSKAPGHPVQRGRQRVTIGGDGEQCSTWNITSPDPPAYIFMLNLHFNLYIHTRPCIFMHVPPPRPHWGVFVTSCRFRGKKAQIGRSSRAGALPPRSKAPGPPVQRGRQRVPEAG